ncbi:MAG: choice-of-anchor J domain-containing protein, partial [Bacteroidales bacterium]|nr:choice-of-anchor J domain-containing protein [Bacteroidales bacterium]
MNKLYKFLLILLVGLASCNPMNDIYNQLDKEVQPPQATFEYTLTDADYSSISSAALKNATNAEDSATASNIGSTNSLPEGFAAQYVPALIQKMYPALGKGSTANVTYNFNNGYVTSVIESYTLSDTDYEAMGGAVAIYKYFSPSNAPEDYLPDFLSTKFSAATDGTYEFVTYNYSATDPQFGEVTVFSDDFSNGLVNFDSVSIVGDQKWYGSSYTSTSGTDYFAKISGYSGGAQDNEDWLISPAINLNGYIDAKLEVSQAAKYLNDEWDQIQVLISSDYSGDVTTANWTQVTIDTLPSGSDYTFVSSGKVDISAYNGMTIHVAFKYLSTTTNAATWEINYIKVYGTVPSKTSVAVGPVATTALYKLSGTTWGEVSTSDYYMLTADDYNAMGNPGPGK